MLEVYMKLIQAKWGLFEEDKNSKKNGFPNYMKDSISFNYIFNPVKKDLYDIFFNENSSPISEELQSLYEECNGMRLCLSGFSIYGIQNHSEQMEPFDLCVENYNNSYWTKPMNYLIFGAYGRDYLFAYKINDMNEIHCIDVEEKTVIMKFKSIKDLFDFFIPRIIKLYDSECKKINPNSDFIGIPALENSVGSIEEIINSSEEAS